jgi:FtsH-binding integral membrane protein
VRRALCVSVAGCGEEGPTQQPQAALRGCLGRGCTSRLCRKVYSILSLQVLFTCCTCALFMLVLPLRSWVLFNTWLIWLALLLSIAAIFAMIKWRAEHPRNMICLGAPPLPPPPPCSTSPHVPPSISILHRVSEVAHIPLTVIFSAITPCCSYTIALVCAAYAAQGQADTGKSVPDALPLALNPRGG